MSNKINVTARIDRPSKVNHSDTKRQCHHTNCKTLLSIYNFTNYCSIHERYTLPLSKFI